MQFSWRTIDDFGPRELYALLRLRCTVFIVEQGCSYEDLDGRDLGALHLVAGPPDAPAGGLRVLLPGLDGRSAAAPIRIGRVVVAPPHRGTGLGRRLMEEALSEIARRFGPVPIELSAQSHLEAFYASLGFRRTSDDYDEDGVLHCDMRRDT